MQLKPALGEVIGTTLPDIPAGFSPYSMGPGGGWASKPEGCGNVLATTGMASQVIDWSQASCFTVALPASGITWSPTFANPIVGQSILVITTQGATSASTASWPSGVKMSGGTKSLTATTGAVDMFTITCVAAGVYYGFASQAMS